MERYDASRVTKIEATVTDLRMTFEQIIGSLKYRVLEPLAAVNRRLMDPWNTIFDPADEVEANLRGLNTDSNLFGGMSYDGAFDGRTGAELGSTAQLSDLTRRLSELEVQNTSLTTALDELRTASLDHPPRPGDLPEVADDGTISCMLKRIDQLEAVKGDGVSMGVEHFRNLGDVKDFLRTKVPAEILLAYAFDWVSLVHVAEVADGTQSVEALLSRDHHANKGGFGHIGLAQIYSSMQQAVPGPLAGATGPTISFQQCGDVEESWLYPCEIGRGVLDECHKVRLIGAKRTSTKEHSLQDAFRMMGWALKTHQLMSELIASDFQGHPRLAAYSLGHLFWHRISPNDIKSLETKVSKVTKNQDATAALTQKLKKKHGVWGVAGASRPRPSKAPGAKVAPTRGFGVAPGAKVAPTCGSGVEHYVTSSFIQGTLPSLAPLGDQPTVGIVAKTTGQWMRIAESLGLAISWVWSSDTSLLPLWAKSAFPIAFFTTSRNLVNVDLILCDGTPPGWLDSWLLIPVRDWRKHASVPIRNQGS
jgi:hypothetical protein